MDRDLDVVLVGHREAVAATRGEDFERKAPVRFEPGAAPYPTSVADVLGWLTGHYREHAPHAEQLLNSWRRG